jgi:hypothetical protein
VVLVGTAAFALRRRQAEARDAGVS